MSAYQAIAVVYRRRFFRACHDCQIEFSIKPKIRQITRLWQPIITAVQLVAPGEFH